MKNQAVQEQVRKRVARSGNGGAVWVPKDWLGEEILVTRLQTQKLSLEEDLISMLLPRLKDISGIFLYGSYARKEETRDSDIDILIIAKNKFTVGRAKKFDITVIEASGIQDAVQKNPFVYAIIHEAKPIINCSLLEELRHKTADFKQFIGWFKETTKDSMMSTKELLDLDRLDSPYVASYSVIYSLLLRLRGVFLIASVLNNMKFSNVLFKKFIVRFVSASDFIKISKIYRSIRDNAKVEDVRVEIALADKLLEVLQKEVRKLHA